MGTLQLCGIDTQSQTRPGSRICRAIKKALDIASTGFSYQKETEKIHDKYAARPDGVKYLTLSQFATSYAKTSKKPEDIKFNEFGVTEERGQIIDHLTEEPLPRYIR